MKRTIAATITAVMILTMAGTAFAAPDNNSKPHPGKAEHYQKVRHHHTAVKHPKHPGHHGDFSRSFSALQPEGHSGQPLRKSLSMEKKKEMNRTKAAGIGLL